jgi:hypothetical protein
MGEALAPLLAQHWQRIGHLQFADYPGRGAPGSGTLDFASLFSQIKACPMPSGAAQNTVTIMATWAGWSRCQTSRLMLHCGLKLAAGCNF